MKNMSVSAVLVILLCLAASAAPGVSFGLGLEVDPGEIRLENVPLGEKAAVSALGGDSMRLSVKNKGDSACAYNIKILPVSGSGATLDYGYEDIPDTSWISPEYREVAVDGNSVKAIDLYLNIPDEEKYAGNGYEAVIEVKSRKNSPEDIFVLACKLKILFTTKAGDKNEKR